MNIFERASRCALRFDSAIGELTTEQLWQLQLTRKGDAVDLDKLARATYQELKGKEEVSFVNVKPDPRKEELELKLEILKHVIETKVASAQAAEKAHENAERKRKLLAALSAKEDAALTSMSREEIEAEIAKIGA